MFSNKFKITLLLGEVYEGFSKCQCELLAQLGLHNKEGNIGTEDLLKITAGSSEGLSCYLDQQNLRQIPPLQELSFSSFSLYCLIFLFLFLLQPYYRSPKQ